MITCIKTVVNGALAMAGALYIPSSYIFFYYLGKNIRIIKKINKGE